MKITILWRGLLTWTVGYSIYLATQITQSIPLLNLSMLHNFTQSCCAQDYSISLHSLLNLSLCTRLLNLVVHKSLNLFTQSCCIDLYLYLSISIYPSFGIVSYLILSFRFFFSSLPNMDFRLHLFGQRKYIHSVNSSVIHQLSVGKWYVDRPLPYIPSILQWE